VTSDQPHELLSQLRDELSAVWRTLPFLTTLARHALPVVGVLFFAWPALQLAAYFLIESWLMLSLYAATDLTFNPKYGGRAPRSKSEAVLAPLPQFLAAAALIGVLVGLFGGFIVVGAFALDERQAFLDGGWRETSFLFGLAMLAASCVSEAAHFAQRMARRTPAQVQTDDLRIASLFYRVVLLFMASAVLGMAPWSWAPVVFAIVLGLILTFFEALPRSAALLLGDVVRKGGTGSTGG
jgi:hypothetical protein